MTDSRTGDTAAGNAAQSEKSVSGKKPLNGKRAPHVISDPNQVAQLVMMHLDVVSIKKYQMTIAKKNLADVTRTIQMLQQRVTRLEDKCGSK
jgi:hypothetical protein